MQALGSVASVVAAIREDAAAEVERIEQLTAADVAALRVIPSEREESPPDREERIAAAHRAVEERLAQQEWEGRRALIEQREAWMARVAAAAQGKCDLEALKREALDRVPSATIAVAPDGGCIATAGDVAFDNSLDARARRLEPDWRNALATLYRLEADQSPLAPRQRGEGGPERSEGPGEGRLLQDGAPHPALRATFSPQAGRRTGES